ncbi:MAG: right-handed parallel beta-helix repeat-containing protein [Mediterranea sp.]|nr:right-handed parallel beta-helix repeat-containing protein [Mediterranea sp.]
MHRALLTTFYILVACSVWSCKSDDLDGLRRDVDEIRQELDAMKTQVNILKALAEAATSGKTIDGIVETAEGYKVTLSDGTVLAIKHGANGAGAPEIGIAELDGVYYWTKGGATNWLLDSQGGKIPVVGKDGNNGTNSVTPQIKIADGRWMVSADGGTTWVDAGEARSDSSFFDAISYTSEYVIFTLADGPSIRIPMTPRLHIQLAFANVRLEPGKEARIGYELIKAKGTTQVEVVSGDIIKAKVEPADNATGDIVLLAYYPDQVEVGYTKVVMIATDDYHSAIATVLIDKETVINEVPTQAMTSDAQLLRIPLETNLGSYRVAIEEAAQGWITQTTESAVTRTPATHTESLLFQLAANNTGERRTGLITISGAGVEKTISVSQEAAEQTEEPSAEPAPTPEAGQIMGYAEAVTGGAGATSANIHHFNHGMSLREWLKLREKNKDQTPAIVYLSGTFTKDDGRDSGSPWFDIKRTANISFYGTSNFKMQGVGFYLRESSNIVIRNVYIEQPKADNGADAITIYESSGVWVDHCTFQSMNQTKDYEDGSCDIVHGSTNVTVSWCHYIHTQKSSLVGHSNSQTGDSQIRATFHHNYFDGSSSRHPRVRFGQVHVFNNYYKGVTTYGVGSAYGAKVLVENNLFDGVHLPIDICTFPAKQSGGKWVSNLTGSVAGYVFEQGNLYENKPSNAGDVYPLTNVEWQAYNGAKLATPLVFNDFKPAYSYTLASTESLADDVPAGAGAGKLSDYAQAPIVADNAGFAPGGFDPSEAGEAEPADPDQEDTDTPVIEQPTEPEEPENPSGGENAGQGSGWTTFSYGDANANASVNGGSLALTGEGKFESKKQEFAFFYQPMEGDFTIEVQVSSFTTTSTSNQAMAGIMLSPDLSADATNLLFSLAGYTYHTDTYRRYRRNEAGGDAGGGKIVAGEGEDAGKPTFKMVRQGNVTNLYCSLDGGNSYGTAQKVEFTSTLPEKVYVGLVLSSGSATETATAVFSNLKINGEPVSF